MFINLIENFTLDTINPNPLDSDSSKKMNLNTKHYDFKSDGTELMRELCHPDAKKIIKEGNTWDIVFPDYVERVHLTYTGRGVLSILSVYPNIKDEDEQILLNNYLKIRKSLKQMLGRVDETFYEAIFVRKDENK